MNKFKSLQLPCHLNCLSHTGWGLCHYSSLVRVQSPSACHLSPAKFHPADWKQSFRSGREALLTAQNTDTLTLVLTLADVHRGHEGHLRCHSPALRDLCLVPGGDISVSNLASAPAFAEVLSVTAGSSECLWAAAGAGALPGLPCFAWKNMLDFNWNLPSCLFSHNRLTLPTSLWSTFLSSTSRHPNPTGNCYK